MSINKRYEMLRITKTENAISPNDLPFICLINIFLKYIGCLLVLLMVLYEVCAQLSFMSHPGSEGVIASDKKKCIIASVRS